MQPSFKQPPKVSPQVERIPIKVVCVVWDIEKPEGILEIRQFCIEKGLTVETRQYDSYKYRRDRDEILRLPAFHIEIKGKWERTFYSIGRPYQIILETVEHYHRRQKIKQEKKGRFKKYIRGCVQWMKDKLHKKTAMEKYEDSMRDWSERAK